MSLNHYEQFMRQSLHQAELARCKGEVPIGAIAVLDGKVIARAYNQKETKHDATAHAELLCLKKASKKLENWRLAGVSIYVTLEPCPMCASALIQARVGQIVYGAPDPIMGAFGGKIDIAKVHTANPIPEIIPEVLTAECETLLKEFFKRRRK